MIDAIISDGMMEVELKFEREGEPVLALVMTPIQAREFAAAICEAAKRAEPPESALAARTA